MLRTPMVCASLCLSQSDCIGFEIVDYGICRRIVFFRKIEEVNENSALAKMVWLSDKLTKNEKYPDIDSKNVACYSSKFQFLSLLKFFRTMYKASKHKDFR